MMDIDMPDAPPTYPPLKRRRESDSESTRASSSQAHSQPSIPYSISPNGDALSSSKRRQLESQVLQRRISLSQLQPHDGLVRPTYKPYWHDDGDLIIVVDNHIFKLPRMWLLSSEIFEDMFLMALPPNPNSSTTSMEPTYAGVDAQEMFEGCPVVHLSDKAQDWMAVLQYLDNPR